MYRAVSIAPSSSSSLILRSYRQTSARVRATVSLVSMYVDLCIRVFNVKLRVRRALADFACISLLSELQ